MQRRPAWSGPFSTGVVPILPAVSPLDDISAEWAWGGSSGAGVKVAVIDSGIDANHPAIGQPVSGYVTIQRRQQSLIFDESPHDDAYGHGTACAGIIRGLAPDCELYSIKVLGPALTGEGAVFAAGLRWAIENGMHVCNLSLGTTKRDFYAILHELADAAYFRNIMLVTAANNLSAPSFPSVYASVISVAALDMPDAFTYYANTQPPAEFCARGIDVRVPWLNGESITATGNSFAAPHIAGLTARILGKHPNLTSFQLKAVLRALAANVGEQECVAAL
jgi:subtilisin family serine protease